MGLRRTKMDENSEYASGEFTFTQYSVLSTIFLGVFHDHYPLL